jgi:uncharacterized protein YkwD
MRAAAGHAAAMAKDGFFDHRGPDGAGLSDRLVAEGYGFRLAAENLSAGIADPAAVVRGWMASAGHRRNLLEPAASEAGIAQAAAPPGGRFSIYWALVVASPAAR